jgi:hemerythrin-like domain-containing protein
MKRSEALEPLSHDHHQALFAAQKLRRADEVSAATAVFLEFWRGEGAAHFRIEEDILMPAWLDAAPDADRALAARMADEHLTIRTLARRAERGELELVELRELGELLSAHVRFEERELFPRIEADLDGDAESSLMAEIERAEA